MTTLPYSVLQLLQQRDGLVSKMRHAVELDSRRLRCASDLLPSVYDGWSAKEWLECFKSVLDFCVPVNETHDGEPDGL